MGGWLEGQFIHAAGAHAGEVSGECMPRFVSFSNVSEVCGGVCGRGGPALLYPPSPTHNCDTASEVRRLNLQVAAVVMNTSATTRRSVLEIDALDDDRRPGPDREEPRRPPPF